MISLEYLTYIYNKEPQFITKGETSYYLINDAIASPKSSLDQKTMLKSLKGLKAVFFDSEEAENALLYNDINEDIYYYHKDNLLNEQSYYYRDNRFLIERFKGLSFVALTDKDALASLEVAGANNIIKSFVNKKYNALFYQLVFNDDDYGIIVLIPVTKNIYTICFADFLNANLEKIIHYFIFKNSAIKFLGTKKPIAKAQESGVYPYHFGIILDDQVNQFLQLAKADLRLVDIIKKSRFTEINYQEKYIMTNGYYYFLPFTNVKTSKYCSFEVMAKHGANYLKYTPVVDNKTYFFDFCLYEEFIDAINKVPEYSKQLFDAELNKCLDYNGKFLVIKEMGTIVAGCALEIITDSSVFISYVFTDPAYRFKGYFKKLVNLLINYGNHYQKILHLTAINETAIKVYRENGFTANGHILSDEYRQKKD